MLGRERRDAGAMSEDVPARIADSGRPEGRPESGPGFAVLDLETTGLVSSRDRIVEIAVVRVDRAGRTIDEWSTLVNPGGPVGASHIHGVTATDVRHAPRFAEIVGELTARLAGRALVAHNAVFDLSFLRLEYARAGMDMPEAPYLCTLEASWVYLPHLSRRRLPDCCYACGIALEDAHSALGDARATAGLLACYLDPDVGRSPLPAHLGLPTRAAGIGWPAAPRSRARAVVRGSHAAPSPAAAPGRLARHVEDLPLGAAHDDGAPTEAGPYLELLAEVFDDGVLSDVEVDCLADMAALYSLTREQVLAAHRGFLLALARKAVEDGTVTRDERAELVGTAILLGLDQTIVRALLDEAQHTRTVELSRGLTPLPDGWPYGKPLRVGQSVAFTGCDDLQRARLEAEARRAGLKVTGAVSRLTSVLVTDGANPLTNKAVAARTLGIRVVEPGIFARMLAYIQPPVPADATRLPGRERSAAAPPTRASNGAGNRASGGAGHGVRERSAATARTGPAVPRELPGDDPADIRAWARTQGLSVGTRGRLPADLVDAYRSSHRHPHHAASPESQVSAGNPQHGSRSMPDAEVFARKPSTGTGYT